MARRVCDLDTMFRVLGGGSSLDGFGDLIKPLEDYDRDHNSDLVKTLRVYFGANANASLAAQRLYLHRNSMNYRLERVQEITGLDLTAPKTRLALQLGLLARETKEQA